MKISPQLPRLKGFRFPREIITYAVWGYHRFALSTGDVEDLLAERGVTVSRETIRQWINRFWPPFCQLHQSRPAQGGSVANFAPTCQFNRQTRQDPGFHVVRASE